MLFHEARFTNQRYRNWGCYAIRFVSSNKSKEKIKLSSNGNSSEDDKESKEPDYKEEESNDRQSKEKQEEPTGELEVTTANQVF